MSITWQNVDLDAGGAAAALRERRASVGDTAAGMDVLSNLSFDLNKTQKRDKNKDFTNEGIGIALNPDISDQELKGKLLKLAADKHIDPSVSIDGLNNIMSLRSQLSAPTKQDTLQAEILQDQFALANEEMERMLDISMSTWDRNKAYSEPNSLGAQYDDGFDASGIIRQAQQEAAENTGWFFGNEGGRHLAQRIQGLIDDNEGDPTYTKALAIQLSRMIPQSGLTTWGTKGYNEDAMIEGAEILHKQLLEEQKIRDERKKYYNLERTRLTSKDSRYGQLKKALEGFNIDILTKNLASAAAAYNS